MGRLGELTSAARRHPTLAAGLLLRGLLIGVLVSADVPAANWAGHDAAPGLLTPLFVFTERGPVAHTSALLLVLAADLAILLGLRALFGLRNAVLLRVYWLSPFVLLVAYGTADTALIGAALLCWAMVQMRCERPALAGLLCLGAAAAQFAGLLALPLFAIYYFRNRPLRAQLLPFLIGTAAALALLGLLFPVGAGAWLRDAAALEPWLAKLTALRIEATTQTAPIYLFPLAYLLALFAVWHMRRFAFEVFIALLGLLFLLAFTLTGSAPHWLLWALPLLVFYQSESGTVAAILVNLLALLGALAQAVPPLAGAATVAAALGLIVIASIWRYIVRTNDLLRLSRRPLVIGIAGDSGAGKDTLVDSLAHLFDERSVARLSGDDYHFWDRHKPMWQVMTHLNPRANDLERFARDLTALADGKGIVSPHYDHGSGRKSQPVAVSSNDFIFASGLHALYLPILRDCYDLGIFLDIDDELRRFLKLDRDVKQRGHAQEKVLSAMLDRQADAVQFIKPQRDLADLVLSLRPANPRLLATARSPADLRLKLVARSRQGLHEESLVRVLVGICGLHVDLTLGAEGAFVVLAIEGEVGADDIALAARTLVPQLLPLLRIRPVWEDGVKGLMQLIVLAHLNQALRRRLI